MTFDEALKKYPSLGPLEELIKDKEYCELTDYEKAKYKLLSFKLLMEMQDDN